MKPKNLLEHVVLSHGFELGRGERIRPNMNITTSKPRDVETGHLIRGQNVDLFAGN
jgi:uncharacterized C2H2 Zn-finger protein